MPYTDKYNLILDTKSPCEDPYITLAYYGITIPYVTQVSLRSSNYVHIFYDDDNKVVAFKPCEKDESAYALVTPRHKKKASIRWSGTRHRDHIARLLGVKPEKNKTYYHIKGKYIEEEDILIFELNDYAAK